MRHRIVSRNNSSPLPAEFKFQHPFTMIVAGPTMSGKSTWMKQLLLSDRITPPPNRNHLALQAMAALIRRIERSNTTFGIYTRITG